MKAKIIEFIVFTFIFLFKHYKVITFATLFSFCSKVIRTKSFYPKGYDYFSLIFKYAAIFFFPPFRKF